MLFRSNLSVAAFAMALASCTPAPIDDPFDDTGELIAYQAGTRVRRPLATLVMGWTAAATERWCRE
ncbi:hypothetical protein A3726_36815 [Erythrobacter sp. HI0037]|nr:hypothetical protein A3726_36815 [Erythrobacter sp. HI0037]